MLNGYPFLERVPDNGWSFRHIRRVADHIDPECVARLNQIGDFQAVFTTTYRKLFRPRELQYATHRANGGEFGVLGCTPVLDEGCRGDEVQAWIDEHGEPQAWCIIDDDADFLDHQFDRLVHTNIHDGGLQDEHIEQARQILSQQE